MSSNDCLAGDGAHIDAHSQYETRRQRWSRTPGVSLHTKMYITVLAVLPLLAIGDVSAADTTQRTVMPDFCSRRDVNCVLPDATSSSVVGRSVAPLQAIEPTQTPAARAGSTQSGAAAGATTVVTQQDAGVTTVVTPLVGGAQGVSTVPALPTAASTVTTGGVASGTTSSSATGTTTSSGSISSGSTTTSASGAAGGTGLRDR